MPPATLLLTPDARIPWSPRKLSRSLPLRDSADARQAKKDDCDYVVAHYDLNASEAAISDARLQHASFDGEGPYLVGWSPSNTRGVPDKLVLVVDMSADNSQALIDHKFLFWKE